jgi:hypothetical protein
MHHLRYIFLIFFLSILGCSITRTDYNLEKSVLQKQIPATQILYAHQKKSHTSKLDVLGSTTLPHNTYQIGDVEWITPNVNGGLIWRYSAFDKLEGHVGSGFGRLKDRGVFDLFAGATVFDERTLFSHGISIDIGVQSYHEKIEYSYLQHCEGEFCLTQKERISDHDKTTWIHDHLSLSYFLNLNSPIFSFYPLVNIRSRYVDLVNYSRSGDLFNDDIHKVNSFVSIAPGFFFKITDQIRFAFATEIFLHSELKNNTIVQFSTVF